eukprot:scaffold872_cov421-Prasinococcus_capsulatus_cf.AAC.13
MACAVTGIRILQPLSLALWTYIACPQACVKDQTAQLRGRSGRAQKPYERLESHRQQARTCRLSRGAC